MKNGEDPAFVSTMVELGRFSHGLTKREYFAAMAMQGVLSNSDGIAALSQKGIRIEEYSVLMADALLAELDKTK